MQDAPRQLDLSLGPAVERINGWIDGAIRLLPNVVSAIVIFAVFYALAIVAQKLILKRSIRRKRDNLGVVLGAFVKWAVILLGFLLAATIVIPSLKPGDLIAGLGVGSVAIGFAFKDILQNGSVAKFKNSRAESVAIILLRWLTNKIAAPDVLVQRPSIDLCGSCA